MTEVTDTAPYELSVTTAFLQSAPAILLPSFGRACAIPATNIGIRVFHHFGVDAQPLSCALAAFNPRAMRLMSAATIAKTSMDEAMEVLDADAEAFGLRLGAAPSHRDPKTWNGHLVILLGTQIVDVLLGFWSRPEKGLRLAPASLQRPTNHKSDTVVYTLPGDVMLFYALFPDDKTYRARPDWSSARWKNETGHIIRAMEGLLMDQEGANE